MTSELLMCGLVDMGGKFVGDVGIVEEGAAAGADGVEGVLD